MKNTKKNILLFALMFCAATFGFAQEILNFVESPRTIKGHRTSVGDLEFSSDGSELYSCGGNNQIIVFDFATGEQIGSKEPNEMGFPINKITLSYNDELIAYSGFNSEFVNVCNTSSFDVSTKIEGFGSVDDLIFSPVYNNLTIVGTRNEKQSIVSYDVETGLEYVTYFSQIDESWPNNLDFSTDGSIIAAGICNYKQGVRLWDFDSGKEVMTILSEDDINMVKFSPDGKYIAGACGNHNVYIWDVETGELVQTLVGLEDMVMTLDFSPDGMYLAAAGFDHNCTFKMWNTETAELVQTLGGRGPDIHELLFTQDGQSIAVAYRTYGDLFDMPTINIFSTEKVALETPWFEVLSDKANLEIEFPSDVDEVVKSDSYYEYYDYTLSQPGEVYQVRATKYLYDINDSKRNSTIDKQVTKFSTGKTDVTKSDFDCDGCSGYIGVDLVGFESNKRYHKRVVFVGSILYTIIYVDFEKESNINETRFFDSFNIKY